MRIGRFLVLSMLMTGMAQAEDKVYGTCSGELSGNDARSHAFSAIGALKKSEIFYAFEINALTRHEMVQKFVRIVPHADDVNKYRKFQVALFKNDEGSIVEMNKDNIDDNGNPTEDFIPYVSIDLPGRAIMALGYGGKNQQGGAQVSVDVYGTKAGISRPKSFKFDSEGKAEFKMKYNVWFDYRDFGGDGILGIFAGDVDAEDYDEAETDTHKVNVEFNCVVYTTDSTADGSRENNKPEILIDSEVQEERQAPASEFSEAQIIRSPRVIRE